MTSRERFFKDCVLKTLYKDEESSDDENEKNAPENLNKQRKVLKRNNVEQPVDPKSEDKDWPVPLPKLKKVYTVAVRPEDLQQTAISKTQGGKNASTSRSSSSGSGDPVHQTEDVGSSPNAPQKTSKNKKRKLKKKRQKEKEREKRAQSPVSREFTY